MSYSKLVSYVKISPHKHLRVGGVNKITIHHMAGNLSVETCGEVFQTKKASSNYGIGTDGRIACYVPEEYRSLCSSSYANDNRAITIEVANCSGSPDWKVSEKAYAALIDLCVDICKRYGFRLNFTGDKKGNLTMHKWFAPTLCPGPYLEPRFSAIAAEVNRRLGVEEYQPTVKEWQQAAMADGFNFPNFGADGIWGAECERVAKAAVVKKRIVYRYKNLTRLVQRVVGEEADGLCGSRTDAAIRSWQLSHGLTPDGAVGSETWGRMLGVK